MQLLLPPAYTAIALGFVDSFSAVSLHRSSVVRRVFALRPTLALRSSISSEGSLLFVVCPSRISTHSVSDETRFYQSLSHHLHLSLTAVSRISSRRLSQNESDKTALTPRGYSKQSKWRRRWSRARPLHHPVQSVRISSWNLVSSFFRRPLCGCNQGFRRWRPRRSRAYKNSAAEWSQDPNNGAGTLLGIWLEENRESM